MRGKRLIFAAGASLLVAAAFVCLPAFGASETGRPVGVIKLNLITPKLTHHKLVLTSSDPVQMRFTVTNKSHCYPRSSRCAGLTLRNVVVLLSPLAIFQSSTPKPTRLLHDTPSGAVKWVFKRLRVNAKRTISATVQFDVSASKPYAAFAIDGWAHNAGEDSRYHRVPVVLQQ